MSQFGVMVSDTSRGEVQERLGRPLIRYDLNEHDTRTFKRGLELLAEIYWAAGAREVLVPVRHVPRLRDGDSEPLRNAQVRAHDLTLMAFHPLGTARAGADPARAVRGRRRPARPRRRRRHVADGSAVPSSLGVNPQITIMALATRLAYHLLGAPPAGEPAPERIARRASRRSRRTYRAAHELRRASAGALALPARRHDRPRRRHRRALGGSVRRRRRRRRDHRRRRRARRRDARLQRRARREGRLRLGHVEPLEQARPRRPALPAAVRPRPRARGAARAPAQWSRSRRTWCKPLPLVVAGVRRNAAGPPARRRPEHVRRHVDGQAAPARAPGQGGCQRRRRARLEPGAPPHHHRRGGRRAAAGAGRARARPAAISSTTARPTTRASC